MTHPDLKWQATSKKHPILQVTSSLFISMMASFCSVFTLFWSGQTWICTWENLFFVTILIKASWVTNSESQFLGVFFISQVFGLTLLKMAPFWCGLVRVRPGLGSQSDLNLVTFFVGEVKYPTPKKVAFLGSSLWSEVFGLISDKSLFFWLSWHGQT